jgi:hypothetical protein
VHLSYQEKMTGEKPLYFKIVNFSKEKKEKQGKKKRFRKKPRNNLLFALIGKR